jgi:hypothetical protein
MSKLTTERITAVAKEACNSFPFLNAHSFHFL